MLKLQTHNDGKERYQSFEARLDDSESINYLCGYGENKEEAITKLKRQITLKIKELQEEKYKKVCVTGMARGEKMTITEGLFKGQTATLIEEKNNKTILVLDSLGTTLILEK